MDYNFEPQNSFSTVESHSAYTDDFIDIHKYLFLIFAWRISELYTRCHY